MKVQKKINHLRPLCRDPDWDTLKASQDPLFIVSQRLPDPICLVCVGKRAFLALSWEEENSQSCSPQPKCHIQAAPSVVRGPTLLSTSCPTVTILPRLLLGAWRREAAQRDELSPYRIHMCHCAGSTCHCLGHSGVWWGAGGLCPAAPVSPQRDPPCPSRLLFPAALGEWHWSGNWRVGGRSWDFTMPWCIPPVPVASTGTEPPFTGFFRLFLLPRV